MRTNLQAENLQGCGESLDPPPMSPSSHYFLFSSFWQRHRFNKCISTWGLLLKISTGTAKMLKESSYSCTGLPKSSSPNPGFLIMQIKHINCSYCPVALHLLLLTATIKVGAGPQKRILLPDPFAHARICSGCLLKQGRSLPGGEREEVKPSGLWFPCSGTSWPSLLTRGRSSHVGGSCLFFSHMVKTLVT